MQLHRPAKKHQRRSHRHPRKQTKHNVRYPLKPLRRKSPALSRTRSKFRLHYVHCERWNPGAPRSTCTRLNATYAPGMNVIEPIQINAIDAPRSLSLKCSVPSSRNVTPRQNRKIATNVVRHGKFVRACPSALRRNNDASLKREEDVSYSSEGISSSCVRS